MNKALLCACLVLTFIASCAESLLVVALFGIPGIVCGFALILRLRSASRSADSQKKNRSNCGNSQSGAHEKDNIGLIPVYQTSSQISRGILS